MADEYKSIYSGQEVDNAVATAQKALTTDNLVQTTGPSPNNIMSQAATTAAIQNIKAGTTVTVNNVAQTSWNADTKVDVFQGIDNTGKVMVVNSSGNLQAETIQSGGTTVTVNGQAQATWDADTKINIFQGTENAGKTFMVGQDGNAVLQTVSSSQGITQLVGTQENPINLHTDTEIGQLYSVSGYIIKSSNVTMSNIPVSLFYRSSDGGGVIYGIHIDDSSYGTTSRCNGTIITFNISTGYMTNFIKFISLSRLNGSTPSSLLSIYAPTSSGESGQVLQSNGENNAPTWIDMPSTAPTLEEQTIESASWTSLSGQTPYTYSATITLTTALDLNSIVELINNQPTLFATYGFAIGSISGQVATIYSIGQPTESITLTVGVTG